MARGGIYLNGHLNICHPSIYEIKRQKFLFTSLFFNFGFFLTCASKEERLRITNDVNNENVLYYNNNNEQQTYSREPEVL